MDPVIESPLPDFNSINSQIARILPEELVRRHNLLPVKKEGGRLIVAMLDPTDLPAIEKASAVSGYQVVPVPIAERELKRLINQHFDIREISRQTVLDLKRQQMADEKPAAARPGGETLPEAAGISSTPAVNLVNAIIDGGIAARASDIHFEPQAAEMVIRYRIDGILQDIMTIPQQVQTEVISRLKVLGEMDITERRHPQDGHMTRTTDGEEYDVRMATLLTVNGEKAVLRLLPKTGMNFTMARLGLEAGTARELERLVAMPHGLILVTGPTGSGKTTTLYTILSRLNQRAVNIITIEDPVEYQLPGINQVRVNPHADLTFAKGLKYILRQDPNVIMVGEIRDRETAEIAIHAALTGHLVLSTLHTNDAPGAVTRLVDMGLEPFLLSSALTGVIAQRLVRQVCPDCRAEAAVAAGDQFAQRFGLTRRVWGRGCRYCSQTGYCGRTGVFEVFTLDEELQGMVVHGATAGTLRRRAVEKGMATLGDNGLAKVRQGVTTIEEVRRVIFLEQEQ